MPSADDSALQGLVASSAGRVPPPASSAVGEIPAWREELNQRIENFRRRRGRLRGTSDSGSNLEFDFEDSGSSDLAAEPEVAQDESVRPAAAIDIDLDKPLRPGSGLGVVESLELGRGDDRAGILESSDLGPEELQPDPRSLRRPVEFVLDSAPPRQEPDPAAIPVGLTRAPMGRRFLGGVIDALVLFLAAGVFALIFWRAGGHLLPNPLNLAIVGFIGALLVIAYFGVFTSLTSTTPGLLWVGIEVRNLSGGHPTARQAFWRAFGYLVSTSALMLGFVWALVDSEGLTWHDRMSDTFLTVADNAVESRKSKVEG